MPTVFDGNVHNQVFVSLALIAGVLGSGSSALVIWLIHRMKVWNLHIALILGMTVFELLYDVSFFTGMVNTGSFPLSISSNLAQLLGGTTSSIISNIIACIALYVVFFKRSLDILPYYNVVIVLSLIPGIVVCILYILAVSSSPYHNLADFAVLGLYYYIRLASICINFICSTCTAVLIHRMRSQGARRTESEIAISTLSMRLFYYPIIQAVGRSGCAWYEMTYKYNFDPDSGFNFNPAHTTSAQFAAQCLMVVSTPLISVGYLCIFLIMQPDALRCLHSLIASITGICGNNPHKDRQAEMYPEHRIQSPLQLQTHYPSSSQLSEVSHTHSRESSMHSVNDAESAVSSRMPSMENHAHNIDLFGD